MDTKVSAPFQFNWKDGNLTESTTYSAEDTISINSALNNVSITSPYTVTGAIGTTAFPNTIYTTGTSVQNPWGPTNASGKIQLDGDSADITINGWSLVDAVKRIEERLGLYQPNPELEKEWEDLHDLAEQYRRLEQHIRDKQATFERLKAMPAPDID